MHFAGTALAASAKIARSFALCPTIGAAARGVREAFFGMEFLLAGSEGEVAAAIAAG